MRLLVLALLLVVGISPMAFAIDAKVATNNTFTSVDSGGAAYMPVSGAHGQWYGLGIADARQPDFVDFVGPHILADVTGASLQNATLK